VGEAVGAAVGSVGAGVGGAAVNSLRPGRSGLVFPDGSTCVVPNTIDPICNAERGIPGITVKID